MHPSRFIELCPKSGKFMDLCGRRSELRLREI
jgi:hypothetical protein